MKDIERKVSLDKTVKRWVYKARKVKAIDFRQAMNDYPRIPERILRQNLETIDSYEGEF